jgi:hypothetical protein
MSSHSKSGRANVKFYLEKPAVIPTSPIVNVSIIDQFIMTDRATVSQPKFVPQFANHELPKAPCRRRRAELPQDFGVI